MLVSESDPSMSSETVDEHRILHMDENANKPVTPTLDDPPPISSNADNASNDNQNFIEDRIIAAISQNISTDGNCDEHKFNPESDGEQEKLKNDQSPSMVAKHINLDDETILYPEETEIPETIDLSTLKLNEIPSAVDCKNNASSNSYSNNGIRKPCDSRHKNEKDKSFRISDEKFLVNARVPKQFCESLPTAKLEELLHLMDFGDGETTRVHDPCRTVCPNSFLGVFYKHFLKKGICNLRNQDCHHTYADLQASIFPFKVKSEIEIDISKLDVLEHFDEVFVKKMQSFLDTHFETGTVPFSDIANLMLANIYLFRQNNFTANELVELESLFHKFNELHHPVELINAYLKQFPRVNLKGVKLYKSFLFSYKSVLQSFPNTRFYVPYYSRNYVLYLPELNFYELFGLLDGNKYENDQYKYCRIFKKYLFFFVRAVESEENPVFFIDDVLFACLKSLRMYETSRLNVMELKYHLSMITLVHRRNQPADYKIVKNSTVCNLDDDNLKNALNFIENFPGIDDALIDYEIKSDLLEASIYLYIGGEIFMDICFRRGSLGARLTVALLSGLICVPPVRKVIMYNAYEGKITTVNMVSRVEEVRKFIIENNGLDCSKPYPIEINLTFKNEDCFVPETINWLQKK